MTGKFAQRRVHLWVAVSRGSSQGSENKMKLVYDYLIGHQFRHRVIIEKFINVINKHDPIRHLGYLRQSLSQDNEAIGFFISAGCPLAVPMPDGKWPLIPDVKNLTMAINAVLTADKEYSCLLSELEKAGKSRENTEDILSFLRSLLAVSKGGEVRGLTEENLNKLEKSICDEIVKKLDVIHPNDETV